MDFDYRKYLDHIPSDDFFRKFLENNYTGEKDLLTVKNAKLAFLAYYAFSCYLAAGKEA